MAICAIVVAVTPHLFDGFYQRVEQFGFDIIRHGAADAECRHRLRKQPLQRHLINQIIAFIIHNAVVVLTDDGFAHAFQQAFGTVEAGMFIGGEVRLDALNMAFNLLRLRPEGRDIVEHTDVEKLRHYASPPQISPHQECGFHPR